jgi:undecaprenyl-diphosphatase
VGALIPILAISPAAALFLGLLQGLTEFLPVSSSGHLVLAQALMHVREQGILLEIVLHAGTLVAVCVALRCDLWQIVREAALAVAAVPRRGVRALAGARGVGLLALATLPAAVAGLGLRDTVESVFENPRATAGCLVVTGLILLATRWLHSRPRPLGWRLALLMGLAQVLSLLPGISRSGSTMSAGLMGGAAPREAVRFSFLMSVPAVLGSLVLSLPEGVRTMGVHAWPALALGFVASSVAGLVAIALVMRIVTRGRFYVFGIYCLLVGIAGWLWLG